MFMLTMILPEIKGEDTWFTKRIEERIQCVLYFWRLYRLRTNKAVRREKLSRNQC